MNTNNIDPHGRTLYSDSVLNRIVTLFPPAKWERQKDGQMGWTFNAVPYGAFNLGKFLLSPPDELLQLQTAIRAGHRQKPEMYGLTPAAFCSYRKSANVKYLTGLMAFDIDAKDNAARLKNYEDLKAEISKIPYVAYCGRSVSGTGFWGLLFIGYSVSVNEYKAAFQAMQEDFEDMHIIIDPAPANPASLRFYSFDPDAYVNHYPEQYTRRWSPPAPQPTAKRYTPTTTRAGEASQPVWEAFNQTADICAMVEHYGFHHPQKDGEGVRYVRPGKQGGKSAWALPAKNIVYIWTSSTNLEPNKCYTPFTLYAEMEHGGDTKAAARALRAQM